MHSHTHKGVEGDKHLQYSGGSAAQSSIIAALDLYLGIDHRGHASYPFLKLMRAYMPKGHRSFLDDLEFDMQKCRESSIRAYALQHPESEVAQGYDACISELGLFRSQHLGIVSSYVLAPQKKKRAVEEAQSSVEEKCGERAGAEEGGKLEDAAGGKGTGGMALNAFLRPLRDQTIASSIKKERR